MFERSRLEAMLGALAHRGPDGEGVHLEPAVALGARRLALVDINGGRQPFATPDGDVHAVVNGEIFNDGALRADLAARGARFRTRCDAELWPHLHQAYGIGGLDRVRGQFAVAVWHRARRELFLARDRHGVCPLHFASADGFLLFASEARALFASGLVEPRPFAPAIDALFAHYAMPPRWTAFEGVGSVAPGHYLRIAAGRMAGGQVEESQWWRPRFETEDRPTSPREEREWAGELDALLARAVTRRLRGDARVASYLSGGVDSSTVATLAARDGGVRDFFHVVPDGAGPDESAAARRTARELGAELHELRVTGPEIAAAIPDTNAAAEHPIVDTSNACLLRLAERVKREGFSVALSGEGADEAFGGYFWTRIESILGRLASRAPFDLRALVRRVTTAGLGHAVALPFDAAQSILYDPLASARTRFYRGALADAARSRRPIDAWSLPEDELRALGSVRRGMFVDTVVMLPGHLLLGKGDRVAMHSAVELRYPFLDEDVVDFCARLPVEALVRNGQGKRLLRAVAADLGVRVARAPKTMFRADRSSLLLGESRPAWVDELLSAESLRRTGFFDPGVVSRERARRPRHGPRTPRQGAMDACLTLVVTTQLWHHQFFGGGLCRLSVPRP